MSRRSRHLNNSIRSSDSGESDQSLQFTPPGFQSDFEKALSIHKGTSIIKTEPNQESLTYAEGSKAVPPRLQALLRLDHLLRPSPLLSSKVERRIVSEPFGRAPRSPIDDIGYNNSRGRRPFLSKSDQRPKSSSKNQLIKIKGLKSRYSAQVSDSDLDSLDPRDKCQSDTTSSKKSYRYNRSWAPSPPSSFSSITTDDDDHKRKSSPSFFYSDEGVASNEAEKNYTPQHQPKHKSPQPASDRSSTAGTSRVSWNREQIPCSDHFVQDHFIDVNKRGKQSITRSSVNLSVNPMDSIVKANVGRNLPMETIIRSLPMIPRPLTRKHVKSSSHNSETPVQVQSKSPADLSMKDSSENPSQTKSDNSIAGNLKNQNSSSQIDCKMITNMKSTSHISPKKSVTRSFDSLKSSSRSLSTAGLLPVIKTLRYGLLQLVHPSGDLTVEPVDGLEVRFWLKKESIGSLGSESGDLIVIKQDGQTIQWMKKFSIQNSIRLVTFYHLSNLELIKSHTPFLIFKIYKPDLIMNWKDQEKIKVCRKQGKVIVWNPMKWFEKEVDQDLIKKKWIGECDEEGQIKFEFLEELRERFKKVKSQDEEEKEKEMKLMEDRLECLMKCVEISDDILKIFKGSTTKDSDHVMVDL
ncbi:hypothetical protein DFH28DRAFT_942445 [Melampsora americana]|nr:hypothetical protein DFH28DRAFT_942445 [Melampsora americana]